PVVAALHGHVLGMGLNLALHCDFRIAHPDASFGFPEVRHGMISAAGAAALPVVTGPTRAMELLLLGHPIGATQALEWGLVSRISEDPWTVAEELAAELSLLDPRAVAATLQLARLSGPRTARLRTELAEARARLRQDDVLSEQIDDSLA